MTEEIEMVEVKLQVPKAIIDFLAKMTENADEYMVHAIISDVACSIEGEEWGPQEIVQGFNLVSAFKKYDVLKDYFPDLAEPATQ